jgi:TolB protein
MPVRTTTEERTMSTATVSPSFSLQPCAETRHCRRRRAERLTGRRSAALAALLLVIACASTERLLGPPANAPAFTILDGANGGTSGFYFLSPLVAEPVVTGTFDPALAPQVRICELAASGCTATVASFGAGTSPAVTVDPKEESYSVLWKTKDANLDPAVTYRLEVRVGAVLLGFADIDVVAKPGELKKVAPGYFGLAAGHPLPIRFRIETGIIGEVIVSPGSAMVGAGSQQQFTVTFFDLHGDAVAASSGVMWSTSDPSIADVDGAGVATAHAPGEAMISASHGQVSGQAALLVLGEILFASNASGNAHLYLQTPGGLPSLLTAGLDVFAISGDATWAPDGASLAVVLDSPNGAIIHLLTLGGTPVPLTPGAGPSWSPDGQRLAFFENDGPVLSGNEIWVVNADGTGLLKLTDTDENDTSPSWSPDGAWIAFERTRSSLPGIYRIRPDGTGATRVSSDLPYVASPVWSPDGGRLVYSASPMLTNITTDVYVVHADGTGEINLTGTSGVQEWDAQWSPDGSRIVFSRSTSMTDSDIWIMNADGTGQVNLTASPGTSNRYPVWSPDGRAIAFSSNRTGDSDIYVVRADGSATLRVTTSPGVDTQPAWRPQP